MRRGFAEFLGVAALLLALLLAGCQPVTAPPPSAPSVETPTVETPSEADQTGADLPPAVEYDLGEATVVQERFPADSRFRNMPVQLNGLIAVPQDPGGVHPDGAHPVVVILHGTHPGCPELEGGVDVWPCDPALEQPNYRGFAYLVRALAGQGYVALSININAEYTFGFGEPSDGERLRQLVDLHLQALATAAGGGENGFGVELAGRADVQRIALIGHSRGADNAFVLANNPDLPLGAEGQVYGPAAGVLLVAPAAVAVDGETLEAGSRVPMAIALPACDGDVLGQDGQHFYEAARLAPNQKAWATSVWLEQANHNAFNSNLGGDLAGMRERPDCATLLAPEAQRAWLVDYADDFLTTLFSHDPAAIRAAGQRMGMDVFDPAPSRLYGLPARAAAMAAANNRLPLLVPATLEELRNGPAGGLVIAEGIATLFCPSGFYSPAQIPGTEPCRRITVTVPGQPALALVSWEQPGGALRFALPPGVGMLNFFDAISLRVGIDPLSPLNAAGEAQAFAVQLSDGAGNTAADEPALQYPPGLVQEDSFFGELFTGRVPLTTLRLPVRAFAGVNLTDIREVALLFNAWPSGALFVADVKLVRSPIGEQETLSEPPSAELIAAAEAGDVEAMRQLANLYRPQESLGVRYGNLERALFWYRQACAAGYANAQVDFYTFASSLADSSSDAYLAEATVCLDAAIEQGHQDAIRAGAFQAAFLDKDYARGFYLYALLEEADPEMAQQRFAFAEQLTADEIETAETAAAAWRAENRVRSYDDFFAEVNSPFRQPKKP